MPTAARSSTISRRSTTFPVRRSSPASSWCSRGTAEPRRHAGIARAFRRSACASRETGLLSDPNILCYTVVVWSTGCGTGCPQIHRDTGSERGSKRMHCPFCRYPDSRVVDSREADDGAAIRRRRSCPECGKRFSTVETAMLTVVKRSGVTEAFSRVKVVDGRPQGLLRPPGRRGRAGAARADRRGDGTGDRLRRDPCQRHRPRDPRAAARP